MRFQFRSWFTTSAVALTALILWSHVQAQPTTPVTRPTIDKATVADAYVYLLGRAIVIRQEQTDLKEPGVRYNTIKYNPVGSADFANPNLDVAYLEAWIAVDDRTAVILDVPEIKGRYYTAQILDEWGEVITNINERNYPSHRHGAFAFVTPAMSTPKPGTGSVYPMANRDSKGRYLDGGKTYSVTLPAPIPINKFWAFPVYDGQTRSLLETDQKTAGIDSNNKSLKANADGSYTVCFGPKAPEGKADKWVQTMPGKSYFVFLRLYGPLEPWFSKTWKPGDFERLD